MQFADPMQNAAINGVFFCILFSRMMAITIIDDNKLSFVLLNSPTNSSERDENTQSWVALWWKRSTNNDTKEISTKNRHSSRRKRKRNNASERSKKRHSLIFVDFIIRCMINICCCIFAKYCYYGSRRTPNVEYIHLDFREWWFLASVER